MEARECQGGLGLPHPSPLSSDLRQSNGIFQSTTLSIFANSRSPSLNYLTIYLFKYEVDFSRS